MPTSLDAALAMLAGGRRWRQTGVDYREAEYVGRGEDVWRDGDAFVHRGWSAHGWGDGPPDDVSETLERWSEETLRVRLGAELGLYEWEKAPHGAPPVVPEFDPMRPMPGAVACARPVSEAELQRVVDGLRGGCAFERAGTEQRGGARVWGRERLRQHGGRFTHTRAWALGCGDEVCVRADTRDEAALRAWLHTRPDVVHWEGWPD